MPSSLNVKAIFAPMQSVDTSTLAGSYVILGSVLPHNAYLVKIVNGSDVPVTVSTDGVIDMDIVPPNSFVLYDICTNASREGGLTMPKGTQFWISGIMGSGSVYLVTQYAG